MVTVGYTSLSLMVPVPVVSGCHMRVLRCIRYAHANGEGLMAFDCAISNRGNREGLRLSFRAGEGQGCCVRRVVGACLGCFVDEFGV